MNKSTICGLALTSLVLSCQAEAIEFEKPITASVSISNQHYSTSLASAAPALPAKKTVTLMNIKLTTQQKEVLNHYPSENQNSERNSDRAGLPRQAELSMNGVPVLDQGRHGTCVTFAVTAALDALLGKGDYLSQLCSLELGNYFEEKGYLPSGWDGPLGSFVINQTLNFGVINKNNQKSKSCGGLKEYPALNPHTIGNAMTLDEFKLMSENISENIYWDPLLSFFQRFQWNPNKTDQGDALLETVKKNLALKPRYWDTRLIFSTLLPVSYCSAGACGRYHAEEDTWALTKAIKEDNNPSFGGHAMIITGYDDDAIAIDHEGMKHQGLLSIRNSWGPTAGDHGTYYMSYDFFKQFVVEVDKIVILK